MFKDITLLIVFNINIFFLILLVTSVQVKQIALKNIERARNSTTFDDFYNFLNICIKLESILRRTEL
jgi:hypothetical protein